VPQHVKPELAVLCQPVGTVIYAVHKLGSVLGKSVLVVGQGPIGLGFTDLLSRAGASQVIVSDVVDARLDLAKRIGATDTVNATREDVVERVKELTGGAMADITVEACGLPETCNQVFQALKVKGTCVIFGMPHGEPVFPFEWATMYNRLPNIIVTNSARAGEVFPAVVTCVDLVAKGRIDLSYLVTHRVPFDNVGEAYELFSRRNDNAVKVLINL
jgi:L-iditol 2-dehydrogenase